MTRELLALLTLVRRGHLARQARSLISQTMVMLLLRRSILASSISISLYRIKVTLELQSKQQSIANTLANIDTCCTYFKKEVINKRN